MEIPAIRSNGRLELLLPRPGFNPQQHMLMWRSGDSEIAMTFGLRSAAEGQAAGVLQAPQVRIRPQGEVPSPAPPEKAAIEALGQLQRRLRDRFFLVMRYHG